MGDELQGQEVQTQAAVLLLENTASAMKFVQKSDRSTHPFEEQSLGHFYCCTRGLSDVWRSIVWFHRSCQ